MSRRNTFFIRTLAAVTLTTTVVAGAHGEGSELPDNSVVISSLPYGDTGDTSDNVNDFDGHNGFSCPFAGSTSPDVFYAFTPVDDVIINVMLCESAYDTKAYVLNAAFDLVACDDDECSSSGGGAFRALLEDVALTGGETYHIAVDGGNSESGVYELLVEESLGVPDCFVSCPGGSVQENEACAEGDLNGGCDSPGQPFMTIGCPTQICGTAWADGLGSDIDFFSMPATAPRLRVTLRIETQFDAVIGYAPTGTPGSGDCNDRLPTVVSFDAPACQETDVELCLGCCGGLLAGDYWFFVTPAPGAEVVCGFNDRYVFEVICGQTLPTEPEPCCDRGDLNEDRTVDFTDLVSLLANWGPSDPPSCADGDVNQDGTTGFTDLVLLLANWGDCPCGPTG